MNLNKVLVQVSLLFISLIISFNSYSQVSVGPRHIGLPGLFDKGVLEEFKKTTTVFVLSNIYEKEIYEKILKESWTVTPYIVKVEEDTDLEELNQSDSLNYSYAILQGETMYRTSSKGFIIPTKHLTYIEIFMYEKDKKKKKRKDSDDKKVINIARINFFSKMEFQIQAMGLSDMWDKELANYETVYDGQQEAMDAIYTENIMYTYKPGFIKNYLQLINKTIEDDKTYRMHGTSQTKKLKELRRNNLYVPEYLAVRFERSSGMDEGLDKASVKELFKDYTFKYEIISTDDLSEKIMNNEDIYYIQYSRIRTEKFVEIINAKTGEIIYKDYFKGTKLKLKSKDIEKISKKIMKAIQGKLKERK